MQEVLECYCEKINYVYKGFNSCHKCRALYWIQNPESDYEIMVYQIPDINYNKSWYFLSKIYNDLVIHNSSNIEIIRITGEFSLDRNKIKASVDKIINRFLNLKVFY